MTLFLVLLFPVLLFPVLLFPVLLFPVLLFPDCCIGRHLILRNARRLETCHTQ
jgi:hypothetical protein